MINKLTNISMKRSCQAHSIDVGIHSGIIKDNQESYLSLFYVHTSRYVLTSYLKVCHTFIPKGVKV